VFPVPKKTRKNLLVVDGNLPKVDDQGRERNTREQQKREG
jgi:hypothetical protein